MRPNARHRIPVFRGLGHRGSSHRISGRVCRHLQIAESTWHRWLSQYGGMKVSDAKRLKELETQNARLKKMVASQALDIDMLKEISAETSNPEPQTQRRAGAARPVRSWITSPCNTGHPITCASTTAPSSSPTPCTIGADSPVPVHFSSTPGRRGRTPARSPRLRLASRVRSRPDGHLTPREPANPGPRNQPGTKPGVVQFPLTQSTPIAPRRPGAHIG